MKILNLPNDWDNWERDRLEHHGQQLCEHMVQQYHSWRKVVIFKYLRLFYWFTCQYTPVSRYYFKNWVYFNATNSKVVQDKKKKKLWILDTTLSVLYPWLQWKEKYCVHFGDRSPHIETLGLQLGIFPYHCTFSQ